MAHLFTTQFPWTNSATCWMHLSTEVESVPEASRPIRLANWITLTTQKREHNGRDVKTAPEERTQLLVMLQPWQDRLFSHTWENRITSICVKSRCVFILKCVTPPFFIRVLTWSTRGSVRSWAMESTLLGPTGFTLITQKQAKIQKAAPLKPESFTQSTRMTYNFSSARGGINIDRYSLQKHGNMIYDRQNPIISWCIYNHSPNGKLLILNSCQFSNSLWSFDQLRVLGGIRWLAEQVLTFVLWTTILHQQNVRRRVLRGGNDSACSWYSELVTLTERLTQRQNVWSHCSTRAPPTLALWYCRWTQGSSACFFCRNS